MNQVAIKPRVQKTVAEPRCAFCHQPRSAHRFERFRPTAPCPEYQCLDFMPDGKTSVAANRWTEDVKDLYRVIQARKEKEQSS